MKLFQGVNGYHQKEHGRLVRIILLYLTFKEITKKVDKLQGKSGGETEKNVEGFS